MKPSRHTEEITPFLVMEILERAQAMERSGIDVVHLEVGEPDFDVPPCVARAAARAIEEGHTHYTHSLGLFELREEIAAYYRKRYGIDVCPERIIVTTGTSSGLALLMAFLLDPGDEVLLPDPGYACYPNFVRSFCGTPRPFPVEEENGCHYNVEAVRRLVTARTRAILVNSPSNPTAAIQDAGTLRELAGLGVPLVSDEIYHGLEYGPRAASLLEITNDGFVLDGFSKRFAMTGWRVGWLVAPAGAVETLQKLQQNLFICAGSVAQHAAVAALREGGEDVEAMRRQYAERRGILLEGLRGLGFGIACEPRGAYYVFADARHLGADSLPLAHRILDEARVGVTPGIDFGSRAEGHLRFSFASSAERIREGLRRIETWLAGRHRSCRTSRWDGDRRGG